MNNEPQDSPETVCSRCGGEANWRFCDEKEQVVEITCPDCGRYELTRVEFEQAEFEIVPTDERRE